MARKGKRSREASLEEKRKKIPFSKLATVFTMACGFIIAQECIILIAFAIHRSFVATAAYLTAAVGLAEAVIGAALSFYISLNKKEKTCGGITFEAAKARNFEPEESKNSPRI